MEEQIWIATSLDSSSDSGLDDSDSEIDSAIIPVRKKIWLDTSNSTSLLLSILGLF